MAWAVYLNEQSLGDLGVYVMQVGSGFSGPGRTYPRVEIPGRQGAVYVSDPTTAIRTLRLDCVVTPAARTIAARRTAEDQLKVLAYRALLRVVVDDDVNAPRAIDGVCTSCEITARQHPVDATVSDVTMTIECPDPTWYDVQGALIGFGTVPSAVPLGTAPSGGVVRLVAPSWSAASVTTPTLTYRNAAGVTVQSLALSTTLAAGTDYLEIDLDRQTIVEVQSGVTRNAIGDLTSGDFFALDPMDGDPLNGSYPSLGCSSGAGTLVGQWYGTRRWL